MKASMLAAALGVAMIAGGGAGAQDGPGLDVFWIRNKQARPPASAQEIARAEKRLGVRLPATYVALLKLQDGGYTRYGGLRNAAGRVDVYTLHEGLLPLGELRTLQDIAGDIDFGTTPDWTKHVKDARRWIVLSRHGTEWFLCLDYNQAGAGGEPAIVSLDTSDVPRERFRFPTFDAFKARLVYDGASAGPGHHYAVDAPLDAEAALVKGLERAFNVTLARGPDAYSWFEIDKSWTPPKSWRPHFQLQPNRDRRGVPQLPERAEAAWMVRVVDLPLAKQAGFEGRLRKIGYPVTLVHQPPPE